MMMNIDIIKEYNMLPRGSRVLCAVSGGADSMCLLHLLHSRAAELQIAVFAAHFEHGLRGAESLRDARFVENWCEEKGIPCVIEHGDALAFAKAGGMSTEEAGRELRYAFFARAAEYFGCDKIATAHNADDNAETMLFNLTRGTGAEGLRGIPPVRGKIIRPLLGCTRREIEEYLAENAVPHVEDSSNRTDDYSRNLIRHRVSPVLRELNPKFSAAAMRTAELLRSDADCLESMSREFTGKYFDGESFPVEEFSKLHPAIASRVVRGLCESSLSLSHVEAVLHLRDGSGLAYADLPRLRVRREQGRLYFTPLESAALPAREIVLGQVTSIPEAGIRVRAQLTEYTEEINDLFKTYYFKYESICDNIICAGRRPGDKIRPIGRNCTKSLKSLFLERKMTQQQRDLTPVFRDGKGVLAVYGLAVAERTAAKPGDLILRLDIERE